MSKFYSDTLDEGIRLLYFQSDKSKYREGIRLLEEAVSQEEADAFYFLSRCYAWEDGGMKGNSQKARELVKAGIERGSDLCILGADRMSALNGDVEAAMTHTLEEAFQGVKSMAEAGDAMAQYALALFYFWGDMLMGIQKPSDKDFAKCEKANAREALKWFLKSAEQGCLPSFHNAFRSRCNGNNGVEKDVKDALRFIETMKDKADLFDYYFDVGQEYKSLSEYKDAIRWYNYGRDKGCSYCMNALGLLYLGGEGVKEDDAKAFSLFLEAAEANDDYGAYNAGRCYYYGWGVGKNEEEAFSYFRKSASEGVQGAQNLLAECFYYGRGTQENASLAFTWAQKASRAGVGSASVLMGKCCLYGKGTAVNYNKARELFEEMVRQYTNSEALRMLGVMYDEGLGVQENAELAADYFRQAVEAGNSAAEEDLARFKKTLFGKWKRR